MEDREYIIAGFLGRISFIFSTFSAASPTLFSVRLYTIVYTRLFIFTASVYSIGGAADSWGNMGGGGRMEKSGGGVGDPLGIGILGSLPPWLWPKKDNPS